MRCLSQTQFSVVHLWSDESSRNESHSKFTIHGHNTCHYSEFLSEFRSNEKLKTEKQGKRSKSPKPKKI